MTNISDFFGECQARVETVLKQHLDNTENLAGELNDAAAYSIFNGGKRFRPTLTYACAVALEAELERVDGVAATIELIHCYSLVHDDLPAIDDDDLRRGKPSCHKAYSEATAILVGDALQAFSFELLSKSNPEIPAELKLNMVLQLAKASAFEGMAAGQALDLALTNSACTLNQLEQIHHLKTGKIISACADLSAIACEQAQSKKHQALQMYSKAIGLSFQVRDDILDVEGLTEKLGKNQGSDQNLNKSTYPSLLGLEGAKEKAEELHQQAILALDVFGSEADLLRELSHYVIHREN